jgi:hypothetical protein
MPKVPRVRRGAPLNNYGLGVIGLNAHHHGGFGLQAGFSWRASDATAIGARLASLTVSQSSGTKVQQKEAVQLMSAASHKARGTLQLGGVPAMHSWEL